MESLSHDQFDGALPQRRVKRRPGSFLDTVVRQSVCCP